VVVVSYKDRQIGIAVDRIIGKQEIVMKSLETHFKPAPGLSGAAVLGDGSVVLVLDVLEILRAFKGKNEAVQEKRFSVSTPDDSGDGRPAATDREKTPFAPEKKPPAAFSAASLNAFFQETFDRVGGQLSLLTGKTFAVSEFKVERTDTASLASQMEDHLEDCYFASILKIPDMRTETALLISKRDGLRLYDRMAGNRPGSTKTISDDAVSAIGEINNIVGSTFVNQLADRLDREIHTVGPAFDIRHAGRHFSRYCASGGLRRPGRPVRGCDRARKEKQRFPDPDHPAHRSERAPGRVSRLIFGRHGPFHPNCGVQSGILLRHSQDRRRFVHRPLRLGQGKQDRRHGAYHAADAKG